MPPRDEPHSPASRVTASGGGFQPVSAFGQAASLCDLICLMIAGRMWMDAGKVLAMFTNVEAGLIAFLLASFGWLAMLRLAPARLGRLLDMPWAIADALLVPLFVGGIAALLAFALLGQDHAGAIILWPFAAMTVLLPARLMVSGLARRGVRGGWLRRRIAIVGATEISANLVARMNGRENPETPDIVGIFDDRDATRRPPDICGIPVRGGLTALCELAGQERIDIIVIALPLGRAIDILRMVQEVQWLNAEVVVLLDGENEAPQGTNRSFIAGQPVLQLVRQPMAVGAVIGKAVMDYILAALALLFVSPLLLAATLAIRLETQGPVLFRQQRIGRNGHLFNILKLRTLHWDPTDQGTLGVVSGDARVTRVGGFLRAMCIDELPQLINVLRGEMSMVGPRPHVPRMLVAGTPLDELVPGYGARHRLKPGITGWAQVNGLSGTMTDTAMAREVVAHDLAYLSEWSFWLDLRILARTAVISVFGRKAFDTQSHEWRGV